MSAALLRLPRSCAWFACSFPVRGIHGYPRALHLPRSPVRRGRHFGGRQEGGLGGTWNRGRDFLGPGAVPGSPSAIQMVSLLQFVRSGVGVILTSPSGPPRGGGEVRITETERSDRIAVRRGCRAGIAAYSVRPARRTLYGGTRPLRGCYAFLGRLDRGS